MRGSNHRRWLTRATLVLAVLAAAPTLADIQVADGWSRETVPGATQGAGYFVITNTGDAERTLMRLTATVSDSVMMHTSSVDAQGIARMWPMASLRLQPGETVRFEPNGRHLMFTNLKMPLKAGDRVAVTFQFDKGEPPVTAQFTVRSLLDTGAPAAKDQSGHDRH
jgi:copper(I)-binding protein